MWMYSVLLHTVCVFVLQLLCACGVSANQNVRNVLHDSRNPESYSMERLWHRVRYLSHLNYLPLCCCFRSCLVSVSGWRTRLPYRFQPLLSKFCLTYLYDNRRWKFSNFRHHFMDSPCNQYLRNIRWLGLGSSLVPSPWCNTVVIRCNTVEFHHWFLSDIFEF